MEQRVARRRGGGKTIIDVARLAGVSPMTVSRVVNGEVNVRDATRHRVTEAIRTLGYSPNPAARSLASAGSLRIGLLYSNPSAAYLSEFLLGSLDQCSRSAIQLIVEKCDAEDSEQAAVDHMVVSGVDGVILPPPLCDSRAIVSGLAAAGIPTVVVATGRPLASASAIRIDDHTAAALMTRHLIAKGHSRIGFVRGHPNQTASELRYDGYVAALAEAGLPVDAALVVQGYFTYHSGLEAADALLDLADRPTAIFASNDDMAAAAVAVAHRRGMDVPGDLTVCGFDDTALATTLWPELTTIRQPVAEMSRRAVLLLLENIRRKAEGKPTPSVIEVMDFTLVQRQSDGPPVGVTHGVRSDQRLGTTASAS
ncbi:LacI family transcriptional regulator [Brevundimonas sp. LM2]|uniref:LacI family DNA-binding transcriptional regulator n=1 Tax=Brevundimonas sp. LM2 TaxID=1938605 RepID=UPI000983F8D2|nr:LacI family DNA-binding transcriptional regulator [Brevundimonas sp. LM2]AQR61475.1 LacI family transcriptional regulator [Brevundimonas sp. LM2]